MEHVKATIQSRQGAQPVEYRQNEDGSYSRKNPKGNWVHLDPAYPQHQNAIHAARAALAKAEGTPAQNGGVA